MATLRKRSATCTLTTSRKSLRCRLRPATLPTCAGSNRKPRVRWSPSNSLSFFAQPARDLQSEVSQYPVGAGSLKRNHRFKYDLLFVKPIVGGSSFQHRIFAAHLIDERRRLVSVLDSPHDIKVGHPWLDHHHV